VVFGTGGEAGHLNPETSTAGLVVRQGALLIGAGKLTGASLPGPDQNIGYGMNIANFGYSVDTRIDVVLERSLVAIRRPTPRRPQQLSGRSDVARNAAANPGSAKARTSK
jgi:hypothetical protein